MAMIKNHGRPAVRPRSAGGGGGRAGGGGGSGGSDRIGNDLAKIDFLLKNTVLGRFLTNFGHFRTF